MEHTVVVGYDAGPSSEHVLAEAAGAAAAAGATLTIVHAYHWRPLPTPVGAPLFLVENATREAAEELVQNAAETVRAGYPELTVNAVAVEGRPASVLPDVSRDANLLVVGHRGRGGFPGLGIGSVALRTAACSSVPTLVVRGDRHKRRGTVVAAVDVLDPAGGAEEILEFAFGEAVRRGDGLLATCAWEMFWPPAYSGDSGQLRHAADTARRRADTGLARLLQPWRAKYPEVVAEHKLADGDPTTVLVAASTYADEIVVGARRKDGDGVRLGPVAHTLLWHADCPVAVVPHG